MKPKTNAPSKIEFMSDLESTLEKSIMSSGLEDLVCSHDSHRWLKYYAVLAHDIGVITNFVKISVPACYS